MRINWNQMKVNSMKIDASTTIGIGLVVTLVGAGIAFGMMKERVNNVAEDVAEIKTDVKELHDYVFERKSRTAANQ